MDYIIRPLQTTDEPFLWKMIYYAIYVPEGHSPPSPNIVQQDDIARYVRDWGKDTDCGFLAEDREHTLAVGAVWLRLLTGQNKGYGYIDSKTLELSIAVLPEYRGRGIGTKLLNQLLTTPCGQSSISLSVSVDNPAVRLYKRFGFETIKESAGALTMKYK